MRGERGRKGGEGKGEKGKRGGAGRRREGKGGKGRGGNVEFHRAPTLLSNLTTVLLTVTTLPCDTFALM